MALTESGGAGFSPADIMALTNSNGSNGFGGAGGTWIWVFFLFFLLAWGGNGMFGGSSAVSDAVTRAELADGLGRQDMFRNQDMILTELTAFERNAENQWGNIRYDMLNNFNNVASQLADNRYVSQTMGTEINRNIDAVRYENAKNTCDIISNASINTRDLLANQNAGVQRILDYLTNDKIEALRTDLQSANLTIQNMTQTNALLDQLRPYPIPAYTTSSPYVSSIYSCGCNS